MLLIILKTEMYIFFSEISSEFNYFSNVKENKKKQHDMLN